MGNGDSRKVFRSQDHGDTWDFHVTINGTSPKCELEYFSEADILFHGDVGFQAYSGSQVSTQLDIIYQGHMDVRDIYFENYDPNESILTMLVANDGGLTRVSYDCANNTHASPQNLNGDYLPVTEFWGMGVSQVGKEKVIAGAIHNHTYVIEDKIFKNIATADGGDCEINPINPEIYYYEENGGISVSGPLISGGLWGQGVPTTWFLGQQLELDPLNPYLLYAGLGNSKLLLYEYPTTDINYKSVPPGIEQCGAIGVDGHGTIFLSNHIGGHYTSFTVLTKSTDYGDSWNDLSGSPIYDDNNLLVGTLREAVAYKTITDIVINPENLDELWICLSGLYFDGSAITPTAEKYRVLHSGNGGDSWNDYSEGLSALPCHTIEIQISKPKRLFLGNEVGVFMRNLEDPNSQWECFSEGLPPSIVSDIDIRYCTNELFASTHGRGIFKTSLEELRPLSSSIVLPQNQNIT